VLGTAILTEGVSLGCEIERVAFSLHEAQGESQINTGDEALLADIRFFAILRSFKSPTLFLSLFPFH
jgi:hypothetical protein